MPEDNLKTSVLSSLFWKFLERGGVSGVQFIVQIILARLLLPEDYGIIALIVVFIAISQTFVQSGLGTALIQKKKVTDADYSSVFYLSLGIALVFYCILFLGAPAIAAFYNQPLITPVLRVLGLTLFFGAVNTIQNAVIARNFLFRKLFVSSLGAVLLSGVVGVAMAYAGYGVWALVGQQLISAIALCIIMWFTVQWRPKLIFSVARVRELFSFGWKLLVSGLIDVTYTNLSSLIIGKLYPASMLGYYTKGQEFPNVLVSNINSSIQAVMFPAYAKNQDNRPMVKQIMRRALVTSAFLVFPAMAGLAAVAEPLIELLLTDKWLIAVPFLQIFCAVYALWPIHTVNLQAINALGRSDVFLKLEILKKIVGVSMLAVTVPIGIYAMALGSVVSGIIATFINTYPNKLLLNYSFTEQWRDLMPALILSLVMCGAAYSVLFLGLSALATLVLQIVVGVVVYLGLAWVVGLESLAYVMKTVREYLPGRKGAC
jgi:O-antigen/teichoic acid export membrane protein